VENPAGTVTRYDDGLAVIEHVRSLPYVDGNRIALYGGSFGGDLVLHLITKTKVRAAGVGAPAAFWFLGVDPTTGARRTPEYWQKLKFDQELARKNIAAIRCPLLIQVGSIDSLINLSRPIHDLMEEAGKPVRMEVYADSPHGFYFGRLNTYDRRAVLDSTVSALDSAVAFMKEHTR
jgi:dipeptidyl-peptidase-4